MNKIDIPQWTLSPENLMKISLHRHFNIHKQAELTKNNGLDSSIVYSQRPKDMPPLFLYNIRERVQSSILFIYV